MKSSESESTGHPGNTQFNVNDRLAIVNLVNGYAEYYDHGDLDAWFGLFVDTPNVTVKLGNTEPMVAEGEAFTAFMSSYRKTSVENGIIPRHLVTNVCVREQFANAAKVDAYITFIPLDTAGMDTPRTKGKIDISGTALYRFQVEKGIDGIWRIRRYHINYDQTHV